MNDSFSARMGAEASPLRRVHHIAYVVRDHGATRKFYEDIIGMKLVAAWAEVGEFPEFPNRKIEYLHCFYALADGSTIAFFAFADDDVYEMYKREPSPFIHYSVKIDQVQREALEARIADAGLASFAIDHGYVSSFYVPDPDGLIFEFCVDPDNIAEIDAYQSATAHQVLERWIAGDRQPNNDVRALPLAV